MGRSAAVMLAFMLSLQYSLTSAQQADARRTGTPRASLALAPLPQLSTSATQTPASGRSGVPPGTLAPDLAFADPSDPNPGSGKRKIIAGWASLGFAMVNFAQLPFCVHSSFEGSIGRRTCVRLSLGLAGAGLALGVPLMVFGYRQRGRQAAWKKRHGLRAALRIEGFLETSLVSLSAAF